MQDEIRYDYARQAWVRRTSDGWRYERCAHPSKKPYCYACHHAGEVCTDTSEVR